MALTALEFRALVVARGWSFSALAQRWGVTRERVSQIANHPERRPAYIEDAVFGLPHRFGVARAERGRAEVAAALAKGVKPRRRREKVDWRANERAPGAVLVVANEQGDHLPYGCRGAVLAREVGTRGDRVCVGFESGFVDWFDSSWLDAPQCWLVYNGETAPAAASYLFRGVPQAEADLLSGRLRLQAGAATA